MFAPLDKGASSYDTDYRHTSSSVSDMLSRIDDILSAKPAETESETAPAPEKQEIKTNILGKPIVNNAENVAPEQEERPKTPESGENDNKIVEKATPVPYSEPTEEEIELAKAILLETENIKTDVDDEDHLLRRDAAKRALSIGSYADNSKNIVEKYDEAQKLFEKKPQKDEPPAEEPVDERSAREKLFGTQQNTGDTENPDRAAERAAAAKVLFDKYNKTNEEKPADPSPYPDPYMISTSTAIPGNRRKSKFSTTRKKSFQNTASRIKHPKNATIRRKFSINTTEKHPLNNPRKSISIRRKFSINIIPKEPSRPNPKNITIRKTSSISTTKRKNPRQKKARASISNARPLRPPLRSVSVRTTTP